MMLKAEPILTKESVSEIFDSIKGIFYSLLKVSTKYHIDFTIRISSDGGLSFESREQTKTHTHLKSIVQSKGKVSYIESEIEGN